MEALMKIGFIGCGNMGEAFLRGIISSGLIKVSDIFVYDKLRNDAIHKAYSVHVCANESEVGKSVDAVFLAVKPDIYPDVLENVKNSLKNVIIVSMAPGISIATIAKKMLPHQNIKIVRTMPNLPLMIGEGCIAYTFGKNLEEKEKEFFTMLFRSIGLSLEIKEELYEAVTGTSGSSPAFVFVFIEALADAAVAAGLSRKDAYHLAAQTVVGSARMVLMTGKHPGELKDNVCSPGGTTIEGIMKLEENGFRGAVTKAVMATIEKAKKIAGQE
jgi:pyrroline-5-carboxylate reductase